MHRAGEPPRSATIGRGLGYRGRMPSIAEDRDAIRDLYARYARALDASRGEELAALFTEDGTFDTRVAGLVVGREALAVMAESTPAGSGHHFLTNFVIDVDGDNATCEASAVVIAKGAIVMSAHTFDRLKRVDGAWLIDFRTYEADPT
jgi:uncharacterized protein (TIGR02246 family)